MDGQHLMTAAARRFLARLVPAGRREWVRAAWAESHAVPPGPQRLAWQAGAAWLAARQLLTPRAITSWLVFTAAAVAAAWVAWPGSPANVTTLADRVDAVATAVLLAAAALLGRRLFGPARDGWLARVIRVSGYAAILAVMPVRAVVEQFTYTVPDGGERLRLYGFVRGSDTGLTFNWAGEILLLLIMTGYAVAVLWLTSERADIGRATLAIGIGGGIAFGAVMYLVAPLGLTKQSTSPWFTGTGIDLLVALAWVMLLGGPVLAGALAARCRRAPGRSDTLLAARMRQGLVAGTLANLTGALIVTLAGTATIALTVKSSAVRTWLLHGQHLSANALYVRELSAGADAVAYVLMCLSFPVLGFLCCGFAATVIWGWKNSGPPHPGRSGGDQHGTAPKPGPIAARL